MREFILRWNVDYPIDRWWRKRYSVPFNSPRHRVSTFIDQTIEFIEDRFFEQEIKEMPDAEEKYTAGQSYLKAIKITEVEDKQTLDDAFENLDLSKF